MNASHGFHKGSATFFEKNLSLGLFDQCTTEIHAMAWRQMPQKQIHEIPTFLEDSSRVSGYAPHRRFFGFRYAGSVATVTSYVCADIQTVVSNAATLDFRNLRPRLDVNLFLLKPLPQTLL